MKIKTVGNGLDRSVKKILSFVLSLAMICTLLSTFGVTAFAEGAIEISDFATLKSTIEGATEPIEIDITTDIYANDPVRSNNYIKVNDGKDITINLNGHTVSCKFQSNNGTPSTLTMNGSGTIKGLDGNSCIYFSVGSTFIANNVKFIAGDGISENEEGGCGIYLENSTIKLNNCYIKGGNSTGTASNSPAIESGGTNDKIYLKNCTFEKGTGGDENIIVATILMGTLLDFEGKEITNINRISSPIIIGDGFVPKEITIKDTHGTPARANTPVTANATIPAPTYTVTIPSTINLGNVNGALEKYRNAETDKAGEKIIAEKSFTVTAVGVDNLFDGKKVAISIGTADVATTITGDGNTITCKLTKGGTAYTEGAEFARFTNDVDLVGDEKNEQTGAVSVNRCDITKTADYIGTLTFNIEIKEGN